jgi:CheY-like chemotaxis protein
MTDKRQNPSGDGKTAGRPLVLVVDDDPLHRKLIELLADQLYISAHMASSCTEAMEVLRTFVFDVILMDIRMPEMDGHDCTGHIQDLSEKFRTIPIIAVTANDSFANRRKCVEAGMHDFLRKPFTVDELQEKIFYWVSQQEKQAETSA